EVRMALSQMNVTDACKHIAETMKGRCGFPPFIPRAVVGVGRLKNVHRQTRKRIEGDAEFRAFAERTLAAKMAELETLPPGTFELLPLRLKQAAMGDAFAVVTVGVNQKGGTAHF